MREWQSLAHVRWECKYHIVWVPKYRRKVLYGKVRRRLTEIVMDLCRQLGVEILEGHAMVDHVHLCVSFPPKYSVANGVGFLKGKSAIEVHREFVGKGAVGKHSWVRGYYAPTVFHPHRSAQVVTAL